MQQQRQAVELTCISFATPPTLQYRQQSPPRVCRRILAVWQFLVPNQRRLQAVGTAYVMYRSNLWGRFVAEHNLFRCINRYRQCSDLSCSRYSNARRSCKSNCLCAQDWEHGPEWEREESFECLSSGWIGMHFVRKASQSRGRPNARPELPWKTRERLWHLGPTIHRQRSCREGDFRKPSWVRLQKLSARKEVPWEVRALEPWCPFLQGP